MNWQRRWFDLRGASAVTACTGVAVDAPAPDSLPAQLAWALAGAMLVVAATSWWPLRKTAARQAAADGKVTALQAALAKAQVRITDFSASQGRFVGNLAQEIKAPLATVLIHADLLLAGSNEPATVQRYARTVAEDMRHLSDLVDSFLRLALPFAQEDTSHHVPVHFHDLVVEAVRRCHSLAGTRAVRVVPMLAETHNGVSVEVLGDAVLLEAMIENLVRNAVLSAPRGSHVDLQVRLQGEEVLLSVRDRGARLDPDHLDSVFDGFFQVPIPPRPSASNGLSLAIARRVAEHHRGSIALRNVPEGGCEFEVQLPRWRAEGPEAASGQ
jgi:signal transduction histidine kinase